MGLEGWGQGLVQGVPGPPCEGTDMTEHITFLPLRWRAVIISLFVWDTLFLISGDAYP